MTRITGLAVALLLLAPSCVGAQVVANGYRGATPAMSASTQGGPIRSKFVDPFMTTEEVDRIFEVLNQPYEFEWDGTTTLLDVRDDLSPLLSIEVDFRALDEFGLSARQAIYPESGSSYSSPRTRASPRTGAQAPFGQVEDAEGQSDSAKRGQTRDPDGTETPNRWWSSLRDRSGAPRAVPIGARLFHFLDAVDLTLNVQHGQLKITSKDSAEAHCNVRIFDVTPLAGASGSATRNSSGIDHRHWLRRPGPGSAGGSRSLVDLIQMTVEPDTWDVFGGPSTITSYSTTDRSFLVIATPLVNQWKIETLLNRLNGHSGKSSD